jgi:hypothetical protein
MARKLTLKEENEALRARLRNLEVENEALRARLRNLEVENAEQAIVKAAKEAAEACEVDPLLSVVEVLEAMTAKVAEKVEEMARIPTNAREEWLDFIATTDMEPADIDRLVELTEALGVTPHARMYALGSTDVLQGLRAFGVSEVSFPSREHDRGLRNGRKCKKDRP